MGSCCSRGSSPSELVNASSPVEDPFSGAARTDKRRRRLSVTQGPNNLPPTPHASSSSDTEVDECERTGRIVKKGSSSGLQRRGRRRVSITTQTVDDKWSRQKGFADKDYYSQGPPPATLGYACKKGLKPESPNQDDFAVLLTDDWEMYAVFDGHGPYGHVVSKFCQDTLPKLIAKDPNFQSDLVKAFKASFIRTHVLCEQTANSDGRFDCSFSGSTATVILRRDGHLYCAWVGDSRAVLATVKPHRNDSVPASRPVAVDLSCDHKPDRPDEKARVEAEGGRILKLGGDIPYRVFVKKAYYPGLAMTRSIGDTVGVSAGISHVPEVSIRPLDEYADKFIIVASDGVWEFISSQEAVNMINKYPPSRAQDAAEALAHEAWIRWMREEHGNSPCSFMVTADPPVASSSHSTKVAGKPSLAASRTRMLRVTNLTRNVDQDHLKEIFGTYARVESVYLAVDDKGYAYVQFATREGAEEAFIHVDKGQIDGNVVKVVFVTPPPPPPEKAQPRKAVVPSGTSSAGDRSRSPPKRRGEASTENNRSRSPSSSSYSSSSSGLSSDSESRQHRRRRGRSRSRSLHRRRSSGEDRRGRRGRR
ncbi:hypothetical protein FOL47_009278 [Perkinsus chesapeaki]|uniref:Uncharacterized protein n=1 Tax=Perkinsus chesapeaki TaxID=330153 RepID=A0A7J6L9B1_PERCH|nr:hypothetical protein FOL47_009278 [Perkinsus chesapeaki]